MRKGRVKKDGYGIIEAVISCKGERSMFSTGKKVLYEDWDEKRQKVKGRGEFVTLINQYLLEVQNKLLRLEKEMVGSGVVLSAFSLSEAYKGKIDSLKSKTLLEVFQKHNDFNKELIGISIAKSTWGDFDYGYRLMREFMKTKLQRKDISLTEVNLEFAGGFHVYLLSKMKQNTFIKYMKLLNKIMRQAVSNGYIAYNPVQLYKVEKEPVDIEFLTEEELRRVINFDTELPRLEKARDLFVFSCFTGLSYIDIKTLTKEHFETDGSGRVWIKKKRVKTGVLSRIPLLPVAKMILEKYKGGDKILPIQDPTDINLYLKDIAILCKIDKRITFHTARHTFATTVTLANNISLEVVAKMMGHTNTRMTSHYAKLVDSAIAHQMDNVMDLY